ncbi:MFS transporter [Chloroflexi bacterium]|nr:MFS transporter [Chloroflexota bacterium]
MRKILKRIFDSLNVRGFRFMWLGDLGLSTAEFMEIVILSWYLLEKTESPLLLGIFAALRFTGTVVAPFFGVIVDRLGRRNIYIFARISFLILSCSVLILTLFNALSVISVFIVAALVGLSRSLDMIVRQSVLPVIVSTSQLQNGVALLRTGRDITQIIGPVLGGVLLESIGVGKSYLFIISLHLFSLMFVFLIPGLPNTAIKTTQSIIENLKGGFLYVKVNPFLFGLLVVAFIVNLTAFPLNNALLPVIARQVMNIDAAGLGWLMGTYSAGSLLGSVVIGYFSTMERAGKAMIIGSILWHIGILIMAYMQWFVISLPVLFFVGISQSFAMVTMAMMLLKYTSEEMRGRVLGLRQLAVYGLPIGVLISGFIAENTNVSVALTFNGVLGLFILVLAILKWPEILHRR